MKRLKRQNPEQRMSRNTILTAAAGVLLTAGVLMPPAAGTHAAPLVEESFNIGTGSGEYTDGASLGGAPTSGANTNGWDGAWSVTGSSDSTSDLGGLSYSAGSVGQIGGTGGSNGFALSNADTRRNIASNTTLQTASTLWARVLLRPSEDTAFFSFRVADGQGDGRFTIRRNPANNVSDILLRPLGNNNNSNDVTDGFTELTAGDTHLMLFKISIDRAGSNAETVDLWINPTTSDESQLGTATASVSGNILDGTDKQFGEFDFTGGNDDQSPRYAIDEIAIGENFNDVVPVPEPGSLALMGLGGLLMLGRGRSSRTR